MKKKKSRSGRRMESAPPLEDEQLRTSQRKENLLNALRKSMGIIITACESVGVSRRTFYDWLATDAEFKKSVAEVEENAVDFAESKLFELMNGVKVLDPDGGNAYKRPPCKTSIIFYLKTKGKERGYVERIEATGRDGRDLYPSDVAAAASRIASLSPEMLTERIEQIKGNKKNGPKP